MPGGNYLTDDQELRLAGLVGGDEERKRVERQQRAEERLHEDLKNLVPEAPAMSAERERELLRREFERFSDERTLEALREARADEVEESAEAIGVLGKETPDHTLRRAVEEYMSRRKGPGVLVIAQSRIHERDLPGEFKPKLYGFEHLRLPVDDEGTR